MCGISGIVGQGVQKAHIEQMAAEQRHRGPDATDTYISPQSDCALGHNRLSIIDLSEAGTQPMLDSTGRFAIVFNGEIYNYRELRNELSDYPYRTHTDTEVLLAAWVKWGADCVKRFIGMFAFAIWDNQEKTLHAVRDRLGIKPFHYTIYQGKFYFASEIKAILAAGVPARAGHGTWGAYLNFGLYDHSAATFFENISVLEPGHVLTFKAGKVTSYPFWNLVDAATHKFEGSETEAIAIYTDLLRDSIRLRLRSDVPLGVNVSGGLDSASLLAMVDRSPDIGDTLKSFTVSFKDTQYDEEDFAAEVPTHKNWQRCFARMDWKDLWDDAARLMYHEEAPYGGIGTLSYFKLFEEIDRQGVTVILEGQGVDETLGGYKYYQSLQNPDNADVLVYQDGSSFLEPDCITAGIREKYADYPAFPKPFATALGNALYADTRFKKLPRVLRMNDRLSMAYGKELREPFLDHRLVEFCFSLPDTFKIKSGNGKYLLRAAMSGILPDDIRFRAKRPVVTPQREWIRGPLLPIIQEIISSSEFAALGLFNVRAVQHKFDAYCDGHGDNAFFIWQWINAYLWARTFQVTF